MARSLFCLALLLLAAPGNVFGAHGGPGGGDGKDGNDWHKKADGMGIPGRHHDGAYARGLNHPAAAGHMAKYGGPGAPINNNHDLRYIQNGFARAMGLPPAAASSWPPRPAARRRGRSG